jgi:hypothetical protein
MKLNMFCIDIIVKIKDCEGWDGGGGVHFTTAPVTAFHQCVSKENQRMQIPNRH